MSKLDFRYENHRDLAMALVGRAIAKDSEGKLPVYRAKMAQEGGGNYSLEIDSHYITAKSNEKSLPIISDSTQLRVLTGGEKLNPQDLEVRMKYELDSIWDSLEEGEKDGMSMVLIQPLEPKGNEKYFTFRRPVQLNLL